MPSPSDQDFREGELAFTGERFIPHQTDPLLALEHYHRYCFASRFLNNGRVLDIACGEGYGSAFMSRWASEVLGIDSDAETIDHARIKYSSIPNLAFEIGRCEARREEIGSFDTIVSFETLEHLEEDDQHRFMNTVQQSLNPGGLFIVSSPDAEEYAAAIKTRNHYHKHELALSELKSFLGAYFRYVHLFAQRVLSFSAIWQMEGWQEAPFQYCARTDLLNEIPAGESFSPPLYLVALCSSLPIRDEVLARGNSIYFDKSSIDQTNELLRWVAERNTEVQHNRDLIQHLQQQVKERSQWALSLETKFDACTQRVLQLQQEIQERTEWLRSVEVKSEERTRRILQLQQEVEERTEWLRSVEAKFEERTQWALSLESELIRERAYFKRLMSSLLYRVMAKIKLLPNIQDF
jgi:2-polyprenyl-3-methyl-5-hydroxy-6-metoxy-1,4-benzoquinol methylase